MSVDRPFRRPALVLVVLASLAGACSTDGPGIAEAIATVEGSPSAPVTATEPAVTADPATPDAPTDGVDKPSVPIAPDASVATSPPAPPATQPPAPVAPPQEPTVFMSEVPMTTGADLPPYDTYVTVIDDTGRISVDVPTDWVDVDGTPVTVSGTTVADIRASSDLAAFASTWTTPGVIVSAGDVPGVTPEQILDDERTTLGSTCTFQGREPYTDGLYVGSFDTYTACGGTTAVYVVIAARPADGSDPIVEVQVQVNAERDIQALDRIVASFVAI